MENNVCPACLGDQIKTVDRVTTSDLTNLYSRAGLDVSRYFDTTPEIKMNQCVACDLRFFVPHCSADDAFYKQLQKFDWYYQSEKPEYAYSQRFISEGYGTGSWLRERRVSVMASGINEIYRFGVQ